MNKDTRIVIRISQEEKRMIEDRYKKIGFRTLSEFARIFLLKKKITSKIDLDCVLQLKRIGTNINQIARRYNAEYLRVAGDETVKQLGEYWKELQAVIEKIKL